MTNPNLDPLKMASEIGDQHRGVPVVGKTKEDTMKNLLSMFKASNEQHRTENNNKSPR
ncbi:MULTISPECIES: hypothetical protein [Vibrio]|uniref:hypothetical protein n=1 Tax=Vibrio TaxID=662 RepID=UPI0015DF36E4|nr:hypothetical protein [Vibrio parahaemolyticus]HAS6209293.1 hypothetical protein [Vibrio vulnificus]EHV5555608.1 hypothetical protein [Vibrio parahaemolyticus]EJG0715045.1 hypothetical protein [Vibrio parahaemolyticus]EJG1748997.1 hypothetical protein [Vibrio parahaemolyticus]MBE5141886.1 hypothetical protein [Vibrio parahaemolyticus]